MEQFTGVEWWLNGKRKMSVTARTHANDVQTPKQREAPFIRFNRDEKKPQRLPQKVERVSKTYSISFSSPSQLTSTCVFISITATQDGLERERIRDPCEISEKQIPIDTFQ